MAAYRIGCGTTGIYCGVLDKYGKRWLRRDTRTDECIGSTCEWMIQQLLGGYDCKKGTTGAYIWEEVPGLEEGKVIELRVTIRDKTKEDDI